MRPIYNKLSFELKHLNMAENCAWAGGAAFSRTGLRPVPAWRKRLLARGQAGTASASPHRVAMRARPPFLSANSGSHKQQPRHRRGANVRSPTCRRRGGGSGGADKHKAQLKWEGGQETASH